MRHGGHRHALGKADHSWVRHYKSSAARLRMMAEAEHEQSLRERLMEQAGEYDKMAESLAS